jgi:hypothetical protein
VGVSAIKPPFSGSGDTMFSRARVRMPSGDTMFSRARVQMVLIVGSLCN